MQKEVHVDQQSPNGLINSLDKRRILQKPFWCGGPAKPSYATNCLCGKKETGLEIINV